MAEQDYVNVTPGVGAAIDADDLAGVAGGGPYRQRVTDADWAVALKNMLQFLSVLGTAQEPSTGRLRVLLDTTGNNVQALGTVTAITGFGTGGTVITDARFLPLEAMYTTWVSSVRDRIT